MTATLSRRPLLPPLIGGLCVLIALGSWRFIPLGIEVSMPHMAHHLTRDAIALYAHLVFAPVALAVLPFQFRPGLRARRPGLHRALGRVYAGAILISGLAGIVLAANSHAGPVAGWGFGLLAVAWLGTTALAVIHALRRNIAAHRAWMIRSAALTFAAVTLRLELPVLAVTFGFDTGYLIVAWACWLPNMVVAEVLARR